MRRLVAAVTVAAGFLAATGCGASGDAYEALPDGVLLLVREPTGDEPAEAQLSEPFEVRVQVDPRVPATNCALQVSLSVGDESGAYRELRSLTFAAPLVGDVVRAAFGFTLDPALGSTTKEQGADVPFDVPVWGTYFAQVSARLVPPAADDPTVALSSLDRCLETLAVVSAEDPSLTTDTYFELSVVEEASPATTDAPDSATTEPENSTDSASSTSTSTIVSPVSTIRPPSSTIRTTTTIRTATTVAPRPSVSIGNDTVLEGDSASTTAQLTVSLSAPTSSVVTVNYTTANGTATTADSDYTAKSGSVAIPAGQTTGTISVSVIGDTAVEETEQFSVTLTSAVGANLLDSSGTVTITNDDTAPLPALSISNNSVAEGDAGSTTVTVTVTLSAASASTVTVDYATGGGTATAGSDYTAESGTITFAPDDTSQTITLTVLGDVEVETPDETFSVVLSGATGATIADSTATVTINDDDVAAAPAMTTIRPGGLYLR